AFKFSLKLIFRLNRFFWYFIKSFFYVKVINIYILSLMELVPQSGISLAMISASSFVLKIPRFLGMTAYDSLTRF
ncbi:MAG: hypothetical protein ACM34N_04465, partial [Ignavibacteria bacterium]